MGGYLIVPMMCVTTRVVQKCPWSDSTLRTSRHPPQANLSTSSGTRLLPGVIARTKLRAEFSESLSGRSSGDQGARPCSASRRAVISSLT
jgi:hypothetical protein